MTEDATVTRPYTTADVARLRGSVHVEHTLARLGAARLRALLEERGPVGLTMDEVALYNRALDAAEIQELANAASF